MAMTPETQKMLMDTLRVNQSQSIAAPLSLFEQIEAQRGLLSTDPVVANLQKLGRGVRSLLEPQSPIDYASMVVPPLKVAPKAKKIATGIYEYRGHIIEDVEGVWNWGKLPKGSKDWTDAKYNDASNTLKDAKNAIDYIIEKNI